MRCLLLLLVLTALALGAEPLRPRSLAELAAIAPPFPRIANCYGAGLGWHTWEQGGAYWSKLDLIIGGCYDLHYDWEHPRWPRVLAQVEDNLARLREVNPHLLALPYVDVVEGPDNPNLPAAWWARNAQGERWSGWPGFLRIDTRLPEVLDFNLTKTRDEILGRGAFDGVFYDCWGPDDSLVPRTAQLRDGRALVMINQWNLPTTGFAHLNGCMAEDETSRIAAGKVDFEEFLARYLRWCRESRQPAVTTLVCGPTGFDGSVWGFQKLTREERAARVAEAGRTDLQPMRFGLATTLMGDGYFAYDAANLGRGQWWWYPEYDAPLGQPRGAASRNADGTWQRAFEGGLVVVNGTSYDAVYETPAPARDVSTGRVSQRFTIPSFDGRILIPSTEPLTAGDDVPPRLTRATPTTVRVAELPDTTVVQTPAGLEVRLRPTGQPAAILAEGKALVRGLWPGIFAAGFEPFEATPAGPPTIESSPEQARLTHRGRFTHGEQRIDYVATTTITARQVELLLETTTATAVNLRMWRHYATLPVSDYAGATLTTDAGDLILPATLGSERLLGGVTRLSATLAGQRWNLTSNLPLTLIDHRQYHAAEYLLAAYPLANDIPAGTTCRTTWTLALEP